MRKAEANKRGSLLAVTDQCHRSAAANISPLRALVELKRAVDLLQAVTPAYAEKRVPVAKGSLEATAFPNTPEGSAAISRPETVILFCGVVERPPINGVN